MWVVFGNGLIEVGRVVLVVGTEVKLVRYLGEIRTGMRDGM